MDASEAENAAGQNDFVVTVNIATELPTGPKSISLVSPNFFYITIFFHFLMLDFLIFSLGKSIEFVFIEHSIP